MNPTNIPEGYQQIMPYLIVPNAAGFMTFMQTVFGATERMKIMRDDTHVMHAELQIGASVIMLADATGQWTQQNAGMFIYVDDCDAVYKKALKNGATSVMEPVNQDYGRASGVKDAHGNTWWITSV